MQIFDEAKNGFGSKISVLMVDDQAIFGEVLKRMIAETGYAFTFCQNPLEAVAVAEKVKPTVILQDLSMPEMDGLDLVKEFRKNPTTAEVPMIVLSATDNAEIKYKAFANGANDYMVKLPDKLEMLARIEYHSKAYINYCEKNRAMQLLQESQNALKKELYQAQSYVESLLPEKCSYNSLSCDWEFQSSTMLGGDCFGYGFIDAENYAVYLLDVCGHGVGAALLSVSAINVLRSRTLASVDFKEPAEVLNAMGKAFDMEKQNGMFFTLWYGVYNTKTRILKYSSGGHPPAILKDKNGLHFLGTKGLVVGSNMGIDYVQEQTTILPESDLFVFSDGVYEVEKQADNSMMTIEDFAEIIKQTSSLKEIKKAVQAVQGRDNFDDDFSLFKVSIK